MTKTIIAGQTWQYFFSMKKIYDNFSDRLFLLSEKNKCLFLGSLPKKDFFDLSKIDDTKEFIDGKIPSFYFPRKLSSECKYYIGYPYLIAKRNKTKIKAPMLFFPVRQDEDGYVSSTDRPFPNRALFLLGEKGKTKRLFEKLSSSGITSVEQFSEVLSACGYNFDFSDKKTPISFKNMPETAKKPKVAPVAVLGRFPVATEIQEDYYRLKKNGLVTPVLEQLLTGKTRKNKPLEKKIRYTEKTDASQEKALLSSNNNIVLFGPPGTGKSQTISAIVGNAVANGKKILVVCQKKVALDVIYSRLGALQNKAFLIVDAKSEKNAFFKALARSYEDACAFERNDDEKMLAAVEEELKSQLSVLETIDETLRKKLPYGPTLSDTYALSCRHPKTEREAKLVKDFEKTGLLNESYEKINYYVDFIKNSKLTEKFIEYQNIFLKNDLARHVQEADIRLLSEVRNSCDLPVAPFPFEKHPCGKAALPPYLEKSVSVGSIASDFVRYDHPFLKKLLSLGAFPPFCFFVPIIIFFRHKHKKEAKKQLDSFFEEFENYAAPYEPYKRFFDKEGYSRIMLETAFGADPTQKIKETVDNYLTIRALKNVFSSLPEEIKSLLLYCYEHSEKTPESMNDILNKVAPIRAYYELLTFEPQAEKTLSLTERHRDTVETILSLQEKRIELGRKVAADKCNENILGFKALFKEKSKEFLFQLGTPTRTVRQVYSEFGEYVTRLLPCLLTTPEVVSNILPLKKETFDIVIFDEASQLSVENAVPSLYRGKTAIVVGDDKQLPPLAVFSKKTAEQDDENIPESVVKARSLLDLAVTVFSSVELTHHYRSERRELIDFSNKYFYGGRLRVVPNPLPQADPPIDYIKVRGKRINGKNEREAEEAARLAVSYSKTGTVGIIAFNGDQSELIAQKIEKKMLKDPAFSKRWSDCFVKSIENVQGEEKDVIIFSVGYAPDKNGKIYARFGYLGMDGGEKRLNVAVTRAKKKMVIVTSIDPEELSVSNVKNDGPKLLKRFLEYAKNVSERASFPLFGEAENKETETEKEIGEKLREIGYDVQAGRSVDPALSLALYDRERNRFLLGIETDELSYRQGGSVYERDVDKTDFFRRKGWKIIRIWTRDWWLSPQNVIQKICFEAEKERAKKDLSIRFSAALPLPAGAVIPQDGTWEIIEN